MRSVIVQHGGCAGNRFLGSTYSLTEPSLLLIVAVFDKSISVGGGKIRSLSGRRTVGLLGVYMGIYRPPLDAKGGFSYI